MAGMPLSDVSLLSELSWGRRPANPTMWIPPEDMDQHAWITIGRRLGAVGRSSNWWIGDWLRYGSTKWGEKYTAAAKITGYDTHTLENMVYVSSRFPFSLRREKLSWSHHFVVAALGLEDQTYWLDLALTQGMSVRDLRLELRSTQRKKDSESADHNILGMNADSEIAVICPQCGYELQKTRDAIKCSSPI
jgi:hypothetical protein